jgi:hypothetical protein
LEEGEARLTAKPTDRQVSEFGGLLGWKSGENRDPSWWMSGCFDEATSRNASATTLRVAASGLAAIL